ncbi:multiple epidermal growth factor-like domains protein 10 [Ostrea edulis]|uniref:multiple epidermal growth factor-like domains protein 10 n=1 Tax=Ostrea edulis TaxID=37623 RepID=UPI0024AF6C74|nr:multiple epidermal growth factor-like domains protein 10 [Ostrea edulis]
MNEILVDLIQCTCISGINMITYLFFVILFQPDWSIAENGGCSESTHGCCAETIWNETLGRCTGCMPGYFGQYCNKTCEYPRYGMRCMKKCECEQDRCNFVTGCPHQEFAVLFTSQATDYSMEMQRADSDNSTNKPIGNCILV